MKCTIAANQPDKSFFHATNEVIIVNSAGTIVTRYDCDTTQSQVFQMEDEMPGMTDEDFAELWPLVVLLVISGVLVKYALAMFQRK